MKLGIVQVEILYLQTSSRGAEDAHSLSMPSTKWHPFSPSRILKTLPSLSFPIIIIFAALSDTPFHVRSLSFKIQKQITSRLRDYIISYLFFRIYEDSEPTLISKSRRIVFLKS